MWIIFAIACAYIASTKEFNVLLWLFIGLLFGIIALGIVLILPSKKEA